MALNLEAFVSLNSAGFERGMHRVKDSVADSIKMFALGAIGVGTVEEAFRRTIQTADDLVNSSKRLNMTVEQVQLLRQAAKEAGKEMGTIETALNKINQARAKALGGDKAAEAAFGALGVSQGDLQTKTAADLFMTNISETVKKVSPEQIALPLREVLGRGAQEATGILLTDFDELGKKIGIISNDTAAKLNQLSKEFDLISQIIISQLAPMLLSLAEWGYRVVNSAGGWLAERGAVMGNLAAQVGQGILEHDWSKGGNMKIDWNEALAEGELAGAPWKENIKRFQESLEAAAKAGNKRPVDFMEAGVTASVMRGGGRIESDALVKVGNFLGSNRAAVNTSAARMETHIAETAAHTKHIAGILETLVGRYLSYGMTTQDASRSANKDYKSEFPNN